jgi:hypothetical protein
MDLATSIQKLISRTPTFETMSAGTAFATDSTESRTPRWRFPIRVASWFAIGAIGVCVAACQSQNGSMVPPASSEACIAKAQEVVPAEASQRSSDLQRDRYYVYRACMHAAGLKH